MKPNNGARLNGWLKLLAVLVPLTVAGLVAFGRLSARADALEAAIQAKASREIVSLQYEQILSELREIKERLRALEKR
jgi:hypothetical protein